MKQNERQTSIKTMNMCDCRDQQDVRRLREQFYIIEMQRDFIIWLCEEECNSTWSEMEKQFNKWQLEQDRKNKTNEQ